MKDKITESFVDLNISNTGYESALQVSNKLQELYFEGKFDEVFETVHAACTSFLENLVKKA